MTGSRRHKANIERSLQPRYVLSAGKSNESSGHGISGRTNATSASTNSRFTPRRRWRNPAAITGRVYDIVADNRGTVAIIDSSMSRGANDSFPPDQWFPNVFG